MAYNVDRICKQYGNLEEKLGSSDIDPMFRYFNVTPQEAKKERTCMGKNYNGGTLPDPYMEKGSNWKGFFMVAVGVAYLMVVFC